MPKKYPNTGCCAVILRRFGLLGCAFVCAAALSVTVLSLAGCDDSSNTDSPEKPVTLPPDPEAPPVSLAGTTALKSYLDSMPENTETTPYRIALSGVDLSSTIGTRENTLRTLYHALSRYVTLDLSGCTGESISNIALNTAPNKAKIVSLILPKTVSTVKKYTFTGCANLVSIEMPEVKSIEDGAGAGSGAFYRCTALTTVSLPKIESIGDNTFYGCSGLTALTIGDTPPDLGGGDVFKNTKAFSAIYIPAGAVETYRNTDKANWTDELKAKVTPL